MIVFVTHGTDPQGRPYTAFALGRTRKECRTALEDRIGQPVVDEGAGVIRGEGAAYTHGAGVYAEVDIGDVVLVGDGYLKDDDQCQ